ncbi:hypothetical protein [Streptomyces sp. L-9-10]|uniref:hypothetical protein n=1 Tax=Streptomyces sp. L-9-10 TaxID=1478131 RepID=UPI0023D91121|nr:hypothetical protein [Streptomyces sp. L-9-10]
MFTPRTLDGGFLLLAGGSGVTPVLSLLKTASAAGRGRIVLVCANRNEEFVLFVAVDRVWLVQRGWEYVFGKARGVLTRRGPVRTDGGRCQGVSNSPRPPRRYWQRRAWPGTWSATWSGRR